MATSIEFKIEFGAGFNVSAGKKKSIDEISTLLEGGPLELTTLEKTHLAGYLEKTNSEHNGIVFSLVSNDLENNEIRKSIKELCNKNNQQSESKKLAIRLSKAMDGRTNEALFLIVVGKNKNIFRVGLITLEKTDIVSTTLDSGKMKLNFGQGFPEEYFKIAVYEGNPDESNSFSDGKVSDHQLNQKTKPASDYWVKVFLQSESEMTPELATLAVTEVIKQAYEKAEADEKEKIIHEIDLMKSQKNLKTTPEQLLKRVLPDNESFQSFAKNKIRLTPAQVKEEFIVDAPELERQFQTKTIVVDSEISIKGLKEIIDKKVKKNKLSNGNTQILIEGKEIYEKYSSQRRTK